MRSALLSRVWGTFVLAAALGMVVTAPAFAQIAGKVQGRVTDAQTGQPIAGAQIVITGTTLGTLTDEDGRYFFNNVPAGLREIRIQFIGYRSVTVQDQRILAGQTLDLDLALEPTAVEVEPLFIVGEREPLVPRDLVTSKSYVTGEKVDNLPLDNLRQIIQLVPGAVESNDEKGLSIRGGRPGEAAVYVDNVLVRSFSLGQTILDVGTNAIEEAALITGGFSAEYGEAQSGVLNFVTRSGTPQWGGSFSYTTDEVAPKKESFGFNRFEGSLGGPLGRGFELFLAGTLDGVKSVNQSRNTNEFPFFVQTGGVDTTVMVDGEPVEIPCFAPWTEGAEEMAFSGAPSAGSNYRARCGGGFDEGNRLPFNIGDNYTVNSKLGFGYGQGSRVSLSYSRSRNQNRELANIAEDFGELFNPAGDIATRNKSEALILNLNQVVNTSADRAVAIQATFSYQVDNSHTAPLSSCLTSGEDFVPGMIGDHANLTGCFEQDARDPALGFKLSDYEFLFDEESFCVSDGSSSPAGEPVAPGSAGALCLKDDLDEMVDLILRGVPVTPGGVNNEFFRPLTTFPNVNPFGTTQVIFSQGGYEEVGRGLGASFSWANEKRLMGRLNVDWQVDRYNRLKLGGEIIDLDASLASTALFRQSFQNFYHVQPLRAGLYAEDRLDLGDVVIFGGLRYDYFDSKASYPVVPGFTFTHQTGVAEADSLCAALGADPAHFDANPGVPGDTIVNPRCKAEKKHALSPRLGVSFPVTENTVFRLSYGHFVQVPDLNELYQGINHDVSRTNTNDIFGRDLDLARTIAFEFGIRHLISPDFVLDISAYNRDKKSDVSGRIIEVLSPVLGSPVNHNIFANADFGNVKGVDIGVTKRFGQVLDVAVSYSGQLAKNTGSQPETYFRTLARAPNNALNQRVPPAEALLITDDNRPHNLSGSISLSIPSDWRQGTTLGSIFSRVGAFATFRFASGLPYTRLENAGDGTITQPDGGSDFGLIAIPFGQINDFRLPWVKNFDLRVTKGFDVGRTGITAFADIRNLFNFENTVRIFAETGTEFNEDARRKFVDQEKVVLGGDVDILNAEIDDEPNRVGLLRAEQRWGNGDGIFTVAEQERAFSAAWDVVSGRSLLVGPPRNIRLGLQVNF